MAVKSQLPYAVAPAGDCASSSSALNDRWLEGDFRFFDKENPALAAEAFFERFADYFAGAKDGVAGIMINVGWFADVVLAYPEESFAIEWNTFEHWDVPYAHAVKAICRL